MAWGIENGRTYVGENKAVYHAERVKKEEWSILYSGSWKYDGVEKEGIS